MSKVKDKIKKLIFKLRLKFCTAFFPQAAIIMRYKRNFGRMPDLINPQTLNEKIINKMLYDRRPILTLVADKYLVRDYVASKLCGDQYLIKMYASVDTIAGIRKLNLPDKFVMKPSHLSGEVKIVVDSKMLAKGELEKIAWAWLRRNYYHSFNEWAYKHIHPRIIFEEMLEFDGKIPDDYKFFCFNGEPRFIQLVKSGRVKRPTNFYDLNFSLLPVKLLSGNFYEKIEIPKNYALMLEIARKLSAGFDFIRVDLYNVNGRIFFGELTNYPNGGAFRFNPSLWDVEFGKYWDYNFSIKNYPHRNS